MKKALRIYLSGTVQSLFFKLFVKENVEKLDVKGFFRKLEDGRVEIFLEGDNEKVDAAANICKKGPKYAQIREVQEKIERFQGFKDFRLINF
jgi:acylphosphatase